MGSDLQKVTESLGNKIFSLEEELEQYDIANNSLQKTIAIKDEYIISLERQIIELNKLLVRTRNEFNIAEERHFQCSTRIEELLNIS